MPDIPKEKAPFAFARALLDAAGTEGSTQASGRCVRLTGADSHAYYPNKAVLAQVLWRTALEEFDRQANDLLRLTEDPIEAIKALGTAYARFALMKPSHLKDLFELDNGRLANALNENPSSENTYLILVQRVTEAANLGLLRPNDPELIAQTLWAGFHGVFSLANSWNDFPFKPQEQLFSSMAEALMFGVLANRAKA